MMQHERSPAVSPCPAKLDPGQLAEVEEARNFIDLLTELDVSGLDVRRVAYLLGRAHGAALGLLDVLDAVTADM